MTEVSPTDDMIDIRDVIERFEELEPVIQDAREAAGQTWDFATPESRGDLTRDEFIAEHLELHDPDETLDFERFTALLEDLKGYGGDEQWRGDWYPITLIADHHFQAYAEELAEDLCGNEMRAASWPLNCIDWERAASQLQADYSTVEFAGRTFWYR